jgi:hypothetical protein
MIQSCHYLICMNMVRIFRSHDTKLLLFSTYIYDDNNNNNNNNNKNNNNNNNDMKIITITIKIAYTGLTKVVLR